MKRIFCLRCFILCVFCVFFTLLL